MVGASSCIPKGCGFHSPSGHIPRLLVQSRLGRVLEATDRCFSLNVNVSLSVPLSLKSINISLGEDLFKKCCWEDHYLWVKMKNQTERMKTRASKKKRCCRGEGGIRGLNGSKNKKRKKENVAQSHGKSGGNRLELQQAGFKLDSGKKCPGRC